MIRYRQLDMGDLSLICMHRREMFIESGKEVQDVDEMIASFSDWLSVRLSNQTYQGFIAEHELGFPVAGIGVMEIDWPPHPSHPKSDSRGYILNLYVMPGYRGQGIAKELMRLGEDYLHNRNIDFAVLHATEAGRPLYERIGWKRSSEMAKFLG